MITVTHQQARFRLAEIIKPIFNQKFVETVNLHLSDYNEAQIPEMLIKNRCAVEQLVDKEQYEGSSSEILCCFYFRYWIAVNQLASENPLHKMGIPDNDKDVLKFFLFDYIEV